MMQYNKDLESQFFTPRESPERPPHFERHKRVISYELASIGVVSKRRKNLQCGTPNENGRIRFKKAGSDMF